MIRQAATFRLLGGGTKTDGKKIAPKSLLWMRLNI
jgi:hypothetical protein